jgi:ABC-type lipoprotein release transport system permease subunit
MDAGGLANHQQENHDLSPRLIWLVGAIAVCRSVLATVFPAIRSAFNL